MKFLLKITILLFLFSYKEKVHASNSTYTQCMLYCLNNSTSPTTSPSVNTSNVWLYLLTSGAGMAIVKTVWEGAPPLFRGLYQGSQFLYQGILTTGRKYGCCLPKDPYENFLVKHLNGHLAYQPTKNYVDILKGIVNTNKNNQQYNMEAGKNNLYFETPRVEISFQLTYEDLQKKNKEKSLNTNSTKNELPNESIKAGALVDDGLNTIETCFHQFLAKEKKIDLLLESITTLYRGGALHLDLRTAQDNEGRKFSEIFVYIPLASHDLQNDEESLDPKYMLIKTSMKKPKNVEISPVEIKGSFLRQRSLTRTSSDEYIDFGGIQNKQTVTSGSFSISKKNDIFNEFDEKK